jgi:hypothetical protein
MCIWPKKFERSVRTLSSTLVRSSETPLGTETWRSEIEDRRSKLTLGSENRQQAGQRLAYPRHEHLGSELAGGHRVGALGLQRLALQRRDRGQRGTPRQ